MSKENFTALVHRTCPICGNKDEDQSELLLHTRFGDLSKFHNQSIGFGNPCKECQSAIDSGAIMIVVIDESKSGKEPEEWYRTGNVFGVTEEAIKNIFKSWPSLPDVLKKRAMVLDYKIAKEIGLPVTY